MFLDPPAAGAIALDVLFGEADAPIPIAGRRTVFHDGFDHSGTRVELYYTLPDVQQITGGDGTALAHALSVLEAQLNLPFSEADAKRLGNFEIFELHAWLDRAEPSLVEPIRPSGNDLVGPETLEDPAQSKDYPDKPFVKDAPRKSADCVPNLCGFPESQGVSIQACSIAGDGVRESSRIAIGSKMGRLAPAP